MDEIWEKAVETALDGQTDPLATRSLTLDGAVKCSQGRLPPSSLLEKFQNLEHLSIADIGVSSLEQFPRLVNLQTLILSDNRIAGGLEFLVQAGLDSLRDLDLSNNRIQFMEDLMPLAQLKLVSLDLYECPVTGVKDYRARVFGLIKSLKYLDKMDAEENERPDSDEEDEEDDNEEDDPGSCEINVEERPIRMSNGHSERMKGVVEVDEEEESEADEEVTGTGRRANGVRHQANEFQPVNVADEERGNEDGETESGEEEIDGEDGEDDDEVVEVHEIGDSDDEVDAVEGEDDDDEGEEGVDNDGGDFRRCGRNGLLMSMYGEIDGHEQGEDDDAYDDGDIGEEEQGVEDGEEWEDGEYGAGYLVQPVALALEEEEEDEEDEEKVENDEDDEVQVVFPPSSSQLKRKRDEDDDCSNGDDDGSSEDNGSSGGGDDDDVVEYKSPKRRHH